MKSSQCPVTGNGGWVVMDGGGRVCLTAARTKICNVTMKVCVAVLFDRWDQLMKSRVSMYKEWTTGWVGSELQAIHKNSFPEIRGATQTEQGRRTHLYTYRYGHNLWKEMKEHTQTSSLFTLMLSFESVQPSSEHGQLAMNKRTNKRNHIHIFIGMQPTYVVHSGRGSTSWEMSTVAQIYALFTDRLWII